MKFRGRAGLIDAAAHKCHKGSRVLPSLYSVIFQTELYQVTVSSSGNKEIIAEILGFLTQTCQHPEKEDHS